MPQETIEQFLAVEKIKYRHCPQGLCPKEYEQLPETLTVREVHCYLDQPGWRSQEITLITTLLNADLYSRSDLLKLYRLRWQVELYLRHLKTTLGMDILRGKTPSLVRKEVYAHLLAYNLLRSWMWQAGMNQKVEPLLLSLQKVRHHLNNWVSELKNCSHSSRPELRQKLWQLMVHQPLKLRKPRSEPRARKRRPLILSFDESTSLGSPAKNRLKLNFQFDKKRQGMRCKGLADLSRGISWVQINETPNKSKHSC